MNIILQVKLWHGLLEKTIFGKRDNSLDTLIHYLYYYDRFNELNSFSLTKIKDGENESVIYFKNNKPVNIEDHMMFEHFDDIDFFYSTVDSTKLKQNILKFKNSILFKYPNAVFYQSDRTIVVFDGSQYKFFIVTSGEEIQQAEVTGEFKFNFAKEEKKLPNDKNSRNAIIPYKPNFFEKLKDRIFKRNTSNVNTQENKDSLGNKSTKDKRKKMLAGIHVDEMNLDINKLDEHNENVNENNEHDENLL